MSDDRGANGRRRLRRICAHRLTGFHGAPAIVSSAFNEVDHFPKLPSHITAPEAPSAAIEGHFPRIAQTVRPDFRTSLDRKADTLVRYGDFCVAFGDRGRRADRSVRLTF